MLLLEFRSLGLWGCRRLVGRLPCRARSSASSRLHVCVCVCACAEPRRWVRPTRCRTAGIPADCCCHHHSRFRPVALLTPPPHPPHPLLSPHPNPPLPQKCLLFDKKATVWTAKQLVLDRLAKVSSNCLNTTTDESQATPSHLPSSSPSSSAAQDLTDAINYGLYLPPQNGRAGKFLAEERLLGDYSLPGPVASLEFKYKRRIYLTIPPDMKARKVFSKYDRDGWYESLSISVSNTVYLLSPPTQEQPQEVHGCRGQGQPGSRPGDARQGMSACRARLPGIPSLNLTCTIPFRARTQTSTTRTPRRHRSPWRPSRTTPR